MGKKFGTKYLSTNSRNEIAEKVVTLQDSMGEDALRLLFALAVASCP